MIALLQRAARGSVVVDGREVGRIGRGLVVLWCAERGDTARQAQTLLKRLLAFRVFPDDAGRMNRSLRDLAAEAASDAVSGAVPGAVSCDATGCPMPAGATTGSDSGSQSETGSDPTCAIGDRAGLLLVPQFTLAADTHSGTRASFTPAAAPDEGRRLFDLFVALARREHPAVETGIFGADMKVTLTNDGPVTFWLDCKPSDAKETR